MTHVWTLAESIRLLHFGRSFSFRLGSELAVDDQKLQTMKRDNTFLQSTVRAHMATLEKPSVGDAATICLHANMSM